LQINVGSEARQAIGHQQPYVAHGFTRRHSESGRDPIGLERGDFKTVPM
jgi:hypothetical protein